jgi:diguanylate cyclase (GGDEF)-like protein
VVVIEISDLPDDVRGTPSVAEARDLKASRRDLAADKRDDSAGQRDQAADMRDRAGDRRDVVADERDSEADERDQIAERRDRAASRSEITAGKLPPDAATVRKQAANDRQHASSDRKAGASERNSAVRDRSTASADRGSGASERTCAVRDRNTAEADRGASKRERADASLDHLTGVFLRGTGFLQLDREIARAKREDKPLVLGFVDVDRLKATNDEHGHAAGDRMLVEVARTLVENLRSYDLIVRYGGDEFVCAISGLTMDEAAKRLSLVNTALAEGPVSGSVTIGLAEMQPDDVAEDLLERADKALYLERQKHRGNGRSVSS